MAKSGKAKVVGLPREGKTSLRKGAALPVVAVRLGAAVHPPPGEAPEPAATTPEWTAGDFAGAWKARWGMGRMSYRVTPGLYTLGAPDARSPVLVTANYKLTFDVLRRSMSGRSAWILVLDTDGVNVWCAAGKGTFGTDELIRRIGSSGLEKRVEHRSLILPQLGAPGVAAHEVRERAGFRVIYGPVRASDLPAFLDAGGKAEDSMRRVSFNLRERAVLIPMELVPALRWSLPVLVPLLVIGGLGSWGFSARAMAVNGLGLVVAWTGAVAAGAVLTPLLLPWLPGRAFSLKGVVPGLLWAALAAFVAVPAATGSGGPSVWEAAAWFLALPALSAFLAMNFTGSSTLTSLSGVRKEMRYAVPLQILGAVAGVSLWVAGHFLGGGA